MMKRTQILALTTAVGFCGAILAGDNWPSFQNGGIASQTTSLSTSNYAVDWTADIAGQGQSSPVAWDGKIFVTSVSGDNLEQLHITAFDVVNGKQLWKHDLPNATPRKSSNYVSQAAPTPVVDEDGIVCFFEGGNLLAFTHDGEVRWQRNLVEEYGAIDSNHGLGSSLEQTAKAVFVWVERKTDPYLLSIDKASGENIWKVAGLGSTSWSSPRLIQVEGGEHLLLSGSGMVIGLDPETGKRLWTFDEISGNTVPTPVPVQEGQFLVGASIGRGDSDAGRAAKSNGVVSVKKDGAGKWQAEYIWQSKRATSSFSSPVVSDGYCYFVNKAGVMYCLDAATGEEQYANRIGGSIWATPIITQDQIILPLKDGKVACISSGKKFKKTSEFDIFPKKKESSEEETPAFGGQTVYAGILIGQNLLVRSGGKVYSLSSPEPAK